MAWNEAAGPGTRQMTKAYRININGEFSTSGRKDIGTIFLYFFIV